MSANGDTKEELLTLKIDEDRFVQLLTKLIDNVSSLQNNPSQVNSLVFRSNITSKRLLDPSATN